MIQIESALVLDVLSLPELAEVAELLADVRSWARGPRWRAVRARLAATEKVLADLDTEVPVWLDAVEEVLDVAVELGVPDFGAPAELRRLTVLVLARDAGIQPAVVRRRRRRSCGLEERLAQVRRESDARITASSGRAIPKPPARPSESERRARLSAWELRSRAA